jgi:hypothetical protein
MNKPDIEISKAVNKLFILASLQENIILKMTKQGLRHGIKQKFNRIHRDISQLNRLVNKTLGDEELEGFDAITEKIEGLFESLE